MKLLAIGGRAHGEWLTYSDYHTVRVAKPMTLRAFEFNTGSALAVEPRIADIEYDEYQAMTLVDPVTMKAKQVWVLVGMSGREAEDGLRTLLLEMFINSKVGEDM